MTALRILSGEMIAEAMAFLEANVREHKRGRLRVSEEEGGWWQAHIEWDSEDGSDAPILGYTRFASTQGEALCKLKWTIEDHRAFMLELSQGTAREMLD